MEMGWDGNGVEIRAEMGTEMGAEWDGNGMGWGWDEVG